MRLTNKNITLDINEKNGLICGLYVNSESCNLADKNGMGSVCYTLRGDDIRTDVDFCACNDREAHYDSIELAQNSVICRNTDLNIKTVYTISGETINIESVSSCSEISQFGICLNMNFLSKKNGTCIGQLLPSSPYTSEDGRYMYCIMPMIEKGFCIVMAKSPCKAWKNEYSSYSFGHYINNFKMLSALDTLYGGEGESYISIELAFAGSIEECYIKIQSFYSCPMLYPVIGGTFSDFLKVKLIGDADYAEIKYNDKTERVCANDGYVDVHALGYGRHCIVPYRNGKAGLDTTVWFGMCEMDKLFEKSCDTIPLHGAYGDNRNLCESMVWCWAKLSFMNFSGDDKYITEVKEAFSDIMGEGDEPVEHHTIVPYPLNGFPAYHIHKSIRIQEQFFGISMLTEMYKLTKNRAYLDYAINAAHTMINCYQRKDGALYTESDYTTVCSPIIALIDLSVVLRSIDKANSDYFALCSEKIARYLVNRGLHFPTEGIVSDVNDEEMEEGSISCTALSLLYFCRYIRPEREYIDFARKVLEFHDWWRIYSPDVRLYMSTMRWWETIWEGDADGPAICAGHAWGIWRAEADFHLAVLNKSAQYFVKSWNGYVSNFSKITENGYTYATYSPDYFTGGGSYEQRRTNSRLDGENIDKRYKITHDYPEHYDLSLSRYVWVRSCCTWFKTAVYIADENNPLLLNCNLKNGRLTLEKSIEDLYIFTDNYNDNTVYPDGVNLIYCPKNG